MIANDQLATELITKMCKPGKVFIDVGAHIGSVISKVRKNDRAVEIVAIEAMPGKIKNLRRKFENVTFHDCAAGESEAEAVFFINTKQSGFSSLIAPNKNVKVEDIHEIRVPVKRLDSLLSPDAIDAIKIDVEGYELGVLRGSESILNVSRPTIMFESGPVEGNDSITYSKEDMWEFLSKHGYLMLLPNRVAHNDDGLSLECFLDSHLYPRRTTNYFAVPKERRAEIRGRARQILGFE